MKIAYKPWNPRQDTLNIVDQAQAIISDYLEAGYTLTLRQLYYQFVAKGLIDNSERSYKNLGNVITKARVAGMVSWEAIEDRNRSLNGFWYDEDMLNPIYELPRYLRYDQWERQEFYMEVWVEKEALGNVVSRACNPYLVPHMSCKGYLSASEAWRAGRRFKDKLDDGKKCILIHLGDHDPSGMDMTRDNQDRLDMFAESVGGVTVIRLALNMDQVEEYSPPPNPAKVTDSRAKNYIKKYGRVSWELDALEPQVMEQMIQTEIREYIDPDTWSMVKEKETEKRDMLRNIHRRWDEIETLLLTEEK